MPHGEINTELHSGERQVAETIHGIRRDHVARYEWAAGVLPAGSRVLDIGCGIGYGAHLMTTHGHSVVGIDRSEEAIQYGNQHYPGGNLYIGDLEAGIALHGAPFDAAVCFEIVEHLKDPAPMLRELTRHATRLLVSVPSELYFPFTGQKFHHRHYRVADLKELLSSTGWTVHRWLKQNGPTSEVEPGMAGRTLLAYAERTRAGDEDQAAAGLLIGESLTQAEADHVGNQAVKSIALTAADASHIESRRFPIDETAAAGLSPISESLGHVAIVGLGPSLADYIEVTKRLGGRSALCDEVWAINALGQVLDNDMVWHMDDVRIQEVRAAAAPKSNIAAMLAWLKDQPRPVMTSRAHPDYPGLVEFPLEDVLNKLGCVAYFNSTAAYAIAYAVYRGATKISLFGLDYTYRNMHDAERGRACVEYWLGIAVERGIELGIAEHSSLLDACAPARERLYGYDTLDVGIDPREDGSRTVTFTPREKLPDAEEIERRYDHNKHPNRLVEAEE
jgi:SAM-dependent methyltransferase